jgi:pimeloyl-ACP methyl ester carboxylesterase
MPTVQANDIEIYHEEFGDRSDPTLLLVNGLGSQAIAWDPVYCAKLVAAGFHVIRYDNRDVGLSTHLGGEPLDVLEAFATVVAGGEIHAPYTLSDMAADGMALLEALGIERAHVAGSSMGGMIVQTMAIEHPERVSSMTSVMSTTGEVGFGMPDPECLHALGSILTPKDTREDSIDSGVALAREIGTAAEFDPDHERRRATEAYDRAYDPHGVARQMMAILGSGDRAAGLEGLDVPAMVLHGDADRLVDISGGHRTAELVPGAEFRQMDGMGHDLPPAYWDRAVGAITDVASRAG